MITDAQHTDTDEDRITQRTLRGHGHLHLRGPHIPHQMAFHQLEHSVYHLMRKLAADYTGGCWGFYALSNGGWFMAPKDATHFTLHDCAGHKVRLTAAGAGLAVCIYLLNFLTWDYHHKGMKAQRDGAQAHYDALMAYARQHRDAAGIAQVLD